MSKAVLMMEMPDCCNSCPICQGIATDGTHVCSILDTDGNEQSNYDGDHERGDYCPLKPMPAKKEENYRSEFARGIKKGWNDAIDAIEGGYPT